MMDVEFSKWLITLGVGGVLAAFMFAFYRKDVKQYTELWRVTAEELISVVKDNTASNVKLITLMENIEKDSIRKITLMENIERNSLRKADIAFLLGHKEWEALKEASRPKEEKRP